MRIFLLIFEFILLVVSFLVFFAWRTDESIYTLLTSNGFYFSLGMVFLSRYSFGLYEWVPQKKLQIIIKSFVALLSSFVLVVFMNYLLAKDRAGLFGRGVLVGALSTHTFILLWIRLWLEDHLRKRQRDRRFVFLIDPETEFWLSKELAKNQLLGTSQFVEMTQFQNMEKLKEFLNSAFHRGKKLHRKIDRLVVACDLKKLPLAFADTLLQFRFEGFDIVDLSSFYEIEFSKLPVRYLSSQFLLATDGFSLLGNPTGLRMKRLADIFLASVLIALTWPLMLLAAVAIVLDSRGGVFYRQVRTGFLGQSFEILKFRSMRLDAEAGGAQWAREKDHRITRVGQFIRLTRIDELPQLWNVLKGQMSFIGPRPERPEFNDMLEKQIPFYDLRHSVRPGLTGWAQVLFPYGASLDDAREKLQFDLYYIKNYSIWLDLSIVLKTVQVVLFGKGR